MSRIATDNQRAITTVPLLLACGIAIQLGPARLPRMSDPIGATVVLHNSSAVAAVRVPELDYVLDSPDFVPEELHAFAARQYVRRNRWL